ncbi:MAG: NADH-quinone oxidoreductase subunit NuoF [Ardenticatenaceae bacterium]|nr:NADH-quinone oxidoreductase subunit NuoF [Ardenticatenaceae bacterium]HBY98560.1 NADH-quinone oxidoreductase subunit NuoF [Chloroflexota bacterium]
MAEQVYNVYRHRFIPKIDQYDVYASKAGGYEGLKQALTMAPEQVIDLVKASGLRGRGGAGFPTGVKWGFLPKGIFPRYLDVNSAEGEPGTFKDREIIENNPQQLIEGIILASYAIGCHQAYIYHRGEFTFGTTQLERAIRDAYAHGWLGKNIGGTDFRLDIYLHPEASAYICGEETAQLNSLEGYLGQPRLKPPFPAVEGLWGKPTIINNVETLTNLPLIVTNGPQWFKQWGTERSPGTRCYSVSGHVVRPGNYELPMNITARELIYDVCGGIWKGRRLKAFIPGGVSAPVLTEQHLDVRLNFDDLMAAGSMGGSGGVIVMDDQTDLAAVASKMIHFYQHESCGKCSPCREGTWWQRNILERMMTARARRGDVELLKMVSEQMAGKCFCPLGESAQMVVLGAYKYFRDDFEAHAVDGAGAAVGAAVAVPGH